MSADDLYKASNDDYEVRNFLLTHSYFEWYTLKIRAKLNTFNGSKKVRLTTLNGAKMNFGERAKELYNLIQKLDDFTE